MNKSIRVVIQEERPLDNLDPEDLRKETHLVTTHEATSEDPQVIAAILRGIANKLDPQKPVTR